MPRKAISDGMLVKAFLFSRLFQQYKITAASFFLYSQTKPQLDVTTTGIVSEFSPLGKGVYSYVQ